MSTITRYPQFLFTEGETDRPLAHSRPIPRSKRIERRIVSIWKVVTRASRKHQRLSCFQKDFVIVTANRRSIMLS
ncbi:hypothetical protein L208DRAFT_1405232 [Tricholoma matsutake]|nr:hypothetical protein L208DRAFT_1405232 [Tricholoma matsutake 945]